MNKKDAKSLSKFLMVGSLLAIILSGVGYFGYDFWLASTQWLLVSTILALFGIYLKLN